MGRRIRDRSPRPATVFVLRSVPEGGRRRGRLLVYLGGALLLVLSLILASRAEARWSTRAARNVRSAAPAFEAAAMRYPLPGGAALLAAVAGHETQCEPLEGTSAEVYGVMQVSWRAWGWLLLEEELASSPQDLLEVETGIFAGAAVLAWLADRYPRRSLDQVLCLYAVGNAALLFERDCAYSRAAARNIPAAARAIWSAR